MVSPPGSEGYVRLSKQVSGVHEARRVLVQVLLTGYYGKANFGDDVLLKVTHGVCRNRWPDAHISVLCDGYQDDYLGTLLGEDVEILAPGDKGSFDLIVHGGGGTFFDFGNYGWFDRILNSLIGMLGARRYARMDVGVRKLLGKQHLKACRRLGWGLGVGRYARGSAKLRRDLPVLLDFDSLVVRDAESVERLKELGIQDKVVEGGDLCFLDEYWVPDDIANGMRRESAKTKLGVVLRDWPYDGGEKYLRGMMKLLPRLRQEFELTLFVFDERTDGRLVELIRDYEPVVWNPMYWSFDAYCRRLGEQDAVVSSRAHGVMCSVVLGVPAVALGIEPKLAAVHERLPGSTRLLPLAGIEYPALAAAIDAVAGCPRPVLREDVASNRHLLEAEMLLANGAFG